MSLFSILLSRPLWLSSVHWYEGPYAAPDIIHGHCNHGYHHHQHHDYDHYEHHHCLDPDYEHDCTSVSGGLQVPNTIKCTGCLKKVLNRILRAMYVRIFWRSQILLNVIL